MNTVSTLPAESQFSVWITNISTTAQTRVRLRTIGFPDLGLIPSLMEILADSVSELCAAVRLLERELEATR